MVRSKVRIDVDTNARGAGSSSVIDRKITFAIGTGDNIFSSRRVGLVQNYRGQSSRDVPGDRANVSYAGSFRPDLAACNITNAHLGGTYRCLSASDRMLDDSGRILMLFLTRSNRARVR